jgi:hypothetical protein
MQFVRGDAALGGRRIVRDLGDTRRMSASLARTTSKLKNNMHRLAPGGGLSDGER